ncbi:hypothetical protein LAZ67_14001478 [Cordylochernes scorpioides]|uniref:RNA-directed DNA polymerase n=1 Tax=Cordylochernes scorpioides TaxID=51811 RepID=A0ABY6L636_9ARAC|nr:hypothetical protein LAZ67_14001478 [Cordylochernes scorpioides]
MSRRRVFEWYKRLKDGREETAVNKRSGRPSTSTTPEKVDKVLELVRKDRRITVREVAEEAGISFGLNLEATTDDPELLKRVITGVETWIYGFDLETTQQASEWRFKNEPRTKKARKAPSKVKVMLTVFFDFQGIVHPEFQQQGSTITADAYLGVLWRLREAIRQELWRRKSWILHHDNAPAHTALKITKFLQDHSTSMFPQPPYSPDLAPCDFFLFGKLKKVKGSEISEHRRDQSGIEEGHESDPENRLPEVFCRLEKKVCPSVTTAYSESRKDNPNEGHHSEEGKKIVQIEKLERAKMEEQTNPSNDTAEQSVPKQETTFEEEETSPPQCTSTDPLTQIADALSKLLVARSPREIDVSPYDGTFEAQSFFDNFDAQADRAELTYTDRLRNLPCYLQGKPLQYFRSLQLDRFFYNDARQTLIDLFPATTEASFARFLAIKLTPQMPLEDYYQNKTVMGMKLNLPTDILIESLTDGLPVADQRLIASVQPNTIKEWFDLVSRITHCATSAVYQRQVDKAPHPTYHNPPPRYNNQWSSRVMYQVTPPPSPCKYCNAMHWHFQCEQRFPQNRTRPVYSARPRTTTVPERGTHTRPKVQSPSHVPQVQAASQDDSTSPASNPTDVKWNWDQDCQQAFTTLKESLTSKPVLHLYQVGLPCRLYCDASTQGIAGILKQVHPDGQVHPVQYFSRALRAHERNYTVSELECLAIVESVDKFRIYLTGIKFTIYTYHQALQWLKTIKNPSGRLFRWSLRLSTYNYEIHYLKGSQQYEADLLSRNPFVGFISADIIKQHQPTASTFNIDTNGLHTITRKGVTKIIIPETLQYTLMNKVHQEYNHPGISQMTRIITTQYYWKGNSKSIEKFVRSCHTSQIIKRPKGKPYGALGQIPPPQQPFDLISIDTIAGFSKYGHSKTYLHVIVDHLTRYAWTFPSKSTSTLTYIQTLKNVLQQGFPKRLLSDRAPAFTSEKFRKFLITHGIQPLLTTSNNPQANGLIERLNATITGKLRLAYLENPKASWTQLVKRVTQTYNNTPHSVTSFPPTYLMFNVVPPDLITHLNPYPEINIAREIARTRTQNKHKKDKETFDKQHRTPHFEVNDLVLVKNYRHPDTGKLAPYFTGPYKIIEIISPNVVRIDRPNQPLNRDSDTIHVNKLKYYTENVLYITPHTRYVQKEQRMSPDVYLSEFKHLTPDIFETQLYRIIPPQTSQPFLHLNPDLFNSDRFKTNLK